MPQNENFHQLETQESAHSAAEVCRFCGAAVLCAVTPPIVEELAFTDNVLGEVSTTHASAEVQSQPHAERAPNAPGHELDIPPPDKGKTLAKVKVQKAVGRRGKKGAAVHVKPKVYRAVEVSPEKNPGERLATLTEAKIEEISAVSARPLSEDEIRLVRETMAQS